MLYAGFDEFHLKRRKERKEKKHIKEMLKCWMKKEEVL
jgi:hypothetical protein